MKLDQKTDTMFIIWPGMTDEDSINEVCQLGKFTYFRKELQDKQFYWICTFHRMQGYELMEEFISKNRIDILENSKIISNRGKIYTLEKFLTSLESVNIK